MPIADPPSLGGKNTGKYTHFGCVRYGVPVPSRESIFPTADPSQNLLGGIIWSIGKRGEPVGIDGTELIAPPEVFLLGEQRLPLSFPSLGLRLRNGVCPSATPPSPLGQCRKSTRQAGKATLMCTLSWPFRVTLVPGWQGVCLRIWCP